MWERYHAFFGAVFHDLPEVLTRDIISPVKAIDGGAIGEIVCEIEREWFEKTFRPMLPKRLYHELRFLALDEFQTKKWPPSEWPPYLPHLDKNRSESIHPGPLVEACDKFAGFMEAYYSFTFGVTSPNLRAAIYPSEETLKKRNKMNAEIYDFGLLYKHFTERLDNEFKSEATNRQ
jgi:putative hydrolase of HD superfamily